MSNCNEDGNYLLKSIDLLEQVVIMKQNEIKYLRLYVKKLEQAILKIYDNTTEMDLDIDYSEYEEYDKNEITDMKGNIMPLMNPHNT
jgi:hypothetical protein